jgi:ribosome-binding factor A
MALRAQRVGERIQRELSDLILKKLNDPRVGFMTITEVRVSDDLRNATVFVSVFGDEKKKKESMEGLKSALPFLQKEVFKRLEIKVSPQIYFKLDDTLEKGSKIDALLRKIKDEAEEAREEPKEDDDAAE